jgi:hypothetical protein
MCVLAHQVRRSGWDAVTPDAIWVEQTPPNPRDREKALELQAEREAYEHEIERTQGVIERDQNALAELPGQIKEQTKKIDQIHQDVDLKSQTIKQNNQKIDQNWQTVVAADNARTAEDASNLVKSLDNREEWAELPPPPDVVVSDPLEDVIYSGTVVDYETPRFDAHAKLDALEAAWSNDALDESDPSDQQEEEYREVRTKGLEFEAWVQDLGEDTRSAESQNMALQSEIDQMNYDYLPTEEHTLQHLQDEQATLQSELEEQQTYLDELMSAHAEAL